jgi:uncharacterized protein
MKILPLHFGYHLTRPRERERPLSRLMTRLAVMLVTACSSDQPDAEPDYSNLGDFDTAQVVITTAQDTLTITAELAETDQQQMLGLMERRSLPELHGMLFIYPTVQDSTAAFYMFRTRIPLDIAFADSAGVIRSIQQMQPCESPNPQLCRTYPANVRFKYALEMNLGFFANHRVNIGDTLRLAKQR